MSLKKAPQYKPLPAEELRWSFDESLLDFDSTREINPIEGILGQDRALSAINLGININSPGYNIYISGLSGTGKTTTVKQILEARATDAVPLFDYAYVNNFSDPDEPILLRFPAGGAKTFRMELNAFINFLKEKIPQTFEGTRFQNKRQTIVGEYSKKEQTLINSFQEKLTADGFSLGSIQVGETARPEIIPVINEKPIPVQNLQPLISDGTITKDAAKEIMQKYGKYQEELVKIFKKGMKLSAELKEKLTDLEKDEVQILVKGAISAFHEKYEDGSVLEFLRQIEESILDNLQIFKGIKPEGDTTPEGYFIDYFREYDINIILDNSNQKQRPIIVEMTPSFTNLFGTIEKINDGKGGWYADFTKIKAGSFLKANGGFLVLNVNHLFEEPGVWRTLKRVLTFRKLEIQETPNYFQFSPSILKPQPIDVDTKVILVGSNYAYSLLSGFEDDFKKIFKVKAEFDYEVERTPEITSEYARVVKKLIEQEKLLEFEKSAIAYLFELSARYAGEKNKLTTRFSVIADIAREADYWAREDKAKIVTGDYVKKSFERARYRHSMSETKLSELIKKDVILIETDGEKVGQLNGLAVYGSDLYAFGKPSKITSALSIGNGNIINVEREAGMSGKTYDKGILIISGYFRETFGQNFPLSFAATLVFEQSYGMIDGDSASAAEIFVLLSNLSKIPLRQYIAVTGSVNQKGEIQPIGGVNEKIEGFYDTCKMKGLTGKQGVIIPYQNTGELMLRDDIIESVKKKEFSIYTIKTIKEGIEILTGIKAGKFIEQTGHYERGTVFGEVEHNLKLFYEKAKNPFKHKDHKEKKDGESKTAEVKEVPATEREKPEKGKPGRKPKPRKKK
ncbi:MAG TPA: AAA family ATPase [Ignavibacteriaceae bacterium]|nr:AAA family ATPase [Ignavibacteriaceae bacterium]